MIGPAVSAEDDRAFMAQALALGRRGMGQVWPNPAVGCVIVQGGRVVGRGWTQAGGRPHAETEALALAGAAARGATAYVSLEPCAHHGRTPPCSEALVAAGVSRVVVAAGDPDPRVSGRGIAILKAAGVSVSEGVCAREAALDHRGFFLRVREGRPFVTLKLALSLDGRIATASGESRWITGPEARRRVHLMRMTHDAVMVGGGTARADDPELTVRGLGAVRQPVRVVLSAALDLPEDGKLAASVPAAPLWLVHADGAPEAAVRRWTARGARLLAVEAAGGGLKVREVMRALAGEGITRVFCEGGGRLAASLLEAGLVDEVQAFHAGVVLGAGGLPGVGALSYGALAAAPRFRLAERRPVGVDALSVWRHVEEDR